MSKTVHKEFQLKLLNSCEQCPSNFMIKLQEENKSVKDFIAL